MTLEEAIKKADEEILYRQTRHDFNDIGTVAIRVLTEAARKQDARVTKLLDVDKIAELREERRKLHDIHNGFMHGTMHLSSILGGTEWKLPAPLAAAVKDELLEVLTVRIDEAAREMIAMGVTDVRDHKVPTATDGSYAPRDRSE